MRFNLTGEYPALMLNLAFESTVTLAKIDVRTYITIHAHESNTKFTSLEHLDWRGTMDDLYSEFTKGRLGNSNMLTSKTIEIRLVYQKNDIVRKFTLSIKL